MSTKFYLQAVSDRRRVQQYHSFGLQLENLIEEKFESFGEDDYLEDISDDIIRQIHWNLTEADIPGIDLVSCGVAIHWYDIIGLHELKNFLQKEPGAYVIVDEYGKVYTYEEFADYIKKYDPPRGAFNLVK